MLDKIVKFPVIMWPDWMDLITRAHCLEALDRWQCVGAVILEESEGFGSGWGPLWDSQSTDEAWVEAHYLWNTNFDTFYEINYEGLLAWDEEMPGDWDPTTFLRGPGVGIGTIIVFGLSINWTGGSHEYPDDVDPEPDFEIIKIIQPKDLKKQTLKICKKFGVLLK